MRKIERLSLNGFDRLRIKVAKGINVKSTFFNRIRFLFGMKYTWSYFKINGGIQVGWVERKIRGEEDGKKI